MRNLQTKMDSIELLLLSSMNSTSSKELQPWQDDFLLIRHILASAWSQWTNSVKVLLF